MHRCSDHRTHAPARPPQPPQAALTVQVLPQQPRPERGNVARLLAHEPRLQPHLPSVLPDQPRLQPNKPRLQPHQPGLQPDVPGVQPHLPRVRPRRPHRPLTPVRSHTACIPSSRHTTRLLRRLASSSACSTPASPTQQGLCSVSRGDGADWALACRYSPTSPTTSPTSPSYSPTSPACAPTACLLVARSLRAPFTSAVCSLWQTVGPRPTGRLLPSPPGNHPACPARVTCTESPPHSAVRGRNVARSPPHSGNPSSCRQVTDVLRGAGTPPRPRRRTRRCHRLAPTARLPPPTPPRPPRTLCAPPPGPPPCPASACHLPQTNPTYTRQRKLRSNACSYPGTSWSCAGSGAGDSYHCHRIPSSSVVSRPLVSAVICVSRPSRFVLRCRYSPTSPGSGTAQYSPQQAYSPTSPSYAPPPPPWTLPPCLPPSRRA